MLCFTILRGNRRCVELRLMFELSGVRVGRSVFDGKGKKESRCQYDPQSAQDTATFTNLRVDTGLRFFLRCRLAPYDSCPSQIWGIEKRNRLLPHKSEGRYGIQIRSCGRRGFLLQKKQQTSSYHKPIQSLSHWVMSTGQSHPIRFGS